jgi:mono/diheme cytochrome c family protein
MVDESLIALSDVNYPSRMFPRSYPVQLGCDQRFGYPQKETPVKTKWLIGMASAGVLMFAGACGGGDDSSDGDESSGGGDAAEGQELFNATCASCHGKDAENPSVGKDLRDNTFVQDNSDTELVAFVKQGRPASDPDNTTGTDMPAKGGNPSLTDEDLESIVAYVKSLQ